MLDEVLDAAAPDGTQTEIRALAESVDGVVAVEKCRARKSGLGLLMDIHIEVRPDITVEAGHEIAHRVIDRLKRSPFPVVDVVVHVEPARPAEQSAGAP